jgi:hypothetical protein
MFFIRALEVGGTSVQGILEVKLTLDEIGPDFNRAMVLGK